ncbi:hypothetical protein DV736_g3744, partial [Chaetothyriales sp. CBS 134916]
MSDYWNQGQQQGSGSPYGYGQGQQGQQGYGNVNYQSRHPEQRPYGQGYGYEQQGYNNSQPPQHGYNQGPPEYHQYANQNPSQPSDQYNQGQGYPQQQYGGGYEDKRGESTYPPSKGQVGDQPHQSTYPSEGYNPGGVAQDPNSGVANDRGLLGAVAGGAAGAYGGHKVHHGFLGAIGGAIAGSLAEDAIKKHKQEKKYEHGQDHGYGFGRPNRRHGSRSSSSTSSSSSDDERKKKKKWATAAGAAGVAGAGAYAYGHHGHGRGTPPPHEQQHQEVLRGNFSASSASITLDKDYDLIASCRTVNGETKLTSISLNTILGNNHGHFVWSRGGNFAASARNIHLAEGGKVLAAELGTGDGGWNQAWIRLDERITNDNGDLIFLDYGILANDAPRVYSTGTRKSSSGAQRRRISSTSKTGTWKRVPLFEQQTRLTVCIVRPTRCLNSVAIARRTSHTFLTLLLPHTVLPEPHRPYPSTKMSLAAADDDFEMLADAIEYSDDELIHGLGEHETIPTQPLQRLHGNTTHTAYTTQPTQLLPRSSPPLSSPTHSRVEVAASSPVPTSAAVRRPQTLLASAIAPAGTAFRPPVFPVQQSRAKIITIDSDDEGPRYKGGSSDDEHDDLRRSDIKPTVFQRRKPDSDTVPESPARGSGPFSTFMSRYRLDTSSLNAVKRPSDTNSSVSTNTSKRPRQTGPSGALPVAASSADDGQDMVLEDVTDWNKRQKLRRMNAVLTSYSLRQCFLALEQKNWNYDDAVDHLLLKSEKAEKSTSRVDLTGSDDELMPTPVGPKKAAQSVKQQAKAPAQSIRDKWASTQQAQQKAPAPKKLAVFGTPPRPPQPRPGRKLIRGQRDQSASAAEEPRAQSGQKSQVISDDETVDGSIQSAHSDSEDLTEARLLKFFNDCTAADLADIAVIELSLAEHVLSKRPFNTLRAIQKVEAPNDRPTKSKRKSVAIGVKISEKVEEMLTSYDAVDFLVKKCEALSKPLIAEMKSWGVKINDSAGGELDITSFTNSRHSSHDSGIGTPISDDEKPMLQNLLGQPATMNSAFKMKDYQIVGMNWLNLLYKGKLSCILADDMGLGKTYQVIAFLSHLRETGQHGPHLVVVPAATLENWLKEFQNFSPQLQVEPYYSTVPGERAHMRDLIDHKRESINVIITTYALAKAPDDHKWLKNFGFKCTVYDEGHFLKNAESQVYRRLIRIKSQFRLLLTGTPLQNNLKELISLLGFMLPDLFKDKYDDLQAIFTQKIKALDENHEALLSAQRIARARSMLTPFILRRKKHQVLKDLPRKNRRVEYCDLTPEQAEVYQTWLQRAWEIREKRERGEVAESSHILMKLRQAAIHSLLFRLVYTDKMLPKIAKQCLNDEQWRESNPDLIVVELTAYSDMEIHTLCSQSPALGRFALHDNEWLASGKVQKMLELLRKFMAEGHRTLIFSQFVMVLDILELVLEREAIAYFRLDGSTPVSERQDLIDTFSADDNDTPVFMLSTKAGGAGINLAKANKVIVFDSGFNPQDDIQAENRAHRIGQVKEVEVVRLVTRGTVEEQIYAMGETKIKLDERVAGVGSGEDTEGGGGGQKKSKQKPGDEKETKVEANNRKQVEEMFFEKLRVEPDKVKEEATSPMKRKKESSQSQSQHEEEGSKTRGKRYGNDDGSDEDGDQSAKTIFEEQDLVILFPSYQ